ncbi:MAG: sigma-70 family RNA polymerase sigma factor [Oscillospiraceae bacterium]|nr:sigma-70 family RNA polymerase sigma factor [Oscillospiraceae bacterium]
MCKDIALNSRQRQLVEDHLSVVDWVLLDYIKAHEGVVGLGREDLRQEGYVWLCRAAVSYDGTSASFGTYARKVVHNGLISYCRKINCQPKMLSLDILQPPALPDSAARAAPGSGDSTDALIDQADAAALLRRLKGKYTGVTKLGIEALELKIKGLNGAEIAALYGVQSNHVSAWISRAAQKLRGDEQFLTYCQRNTVK